jgi:hypothetical protein
MATVEAASAHRIEELVRRIETIPDPESREIVRQLMESILELHGSGLLRMMEITSAAGNPGEALIRQFAGDSLVAALLILHDLHPDDLYTRVHRALGKWHGTAELIGEFEGVIRVRLSGAGCGVREAVEAAIREASPDSAEVIIEESFQPAGFVPLSALGMNATGAD